MCEGVMEHTWLSKYVYGHYFPETADVQNNTAGAFGYQNATFEVT